LISIIGIAGTTENTPACRFTRRRRAGREVTETIAKKDLIEGF
jgi:hypothetical protein